jgi:hypothetical protein
VVRIANRVHCYIRLAASDAIFENFTALAVASAALTVASVTAQDIR